MIVPAQILSSFSCSVRKLSNHCTFLEHFLFDFKSMKLYAGLYDSAILLVANRLVTFFASPSIKVRYKLISIKVIFVMFLYKKFHGFSIIASFCFFFGSISCKGPPTQIFPGWFVSCTRLWQRHFQILHNKNWSTLYAFSRIGQNSLCGK